MNRSQFNEALEKLELLAPEKNKVLQLVLAGLKNPEIAVKTGTKEGTVRKQISKIYESFGIKGEYEGDRRPRRDDLVALFRKYKPEWVRDFPDIVTNEVLIAQTAEVAEQEGAIAKPYKESRKAVDTKENPSEISHNNEASLIREWRFKSIDQLWSKDIGKCIGGIRKLERIAKDYPTEQWAIMEELAEFIRIRTRWKERDEEGSPNIPIDIDIQAALTVIGRRNSEKDPPNLRLDLSNSDIRGANLSEANLQGINFKKANLQDVNFYQAYLQRAILKEANLKNASFYNTKLQETDLRKANLQEAWFLGADLQGAFLSATNMQGVNLWDATLKGASLSIANLERASLNGADLSRANLQGANFMGASLLEVDLAESNLQGTKLRGADLTNAKNLELQQIESAYGDSTTILPENIERPAHWM
jgi:uncharacterized protein YjbI with pentapeptide repeats/DNA-binding CsgD family transcriptional regulator